LLALRGGGNPPHGEAAAKEESRTRAKPKRAHTDQPPPLTEPTPPAGGWPERGPDRVEARTLPGFGHSLVCITPTASGQILTEFIEAQVVTGKRKRELENARAGLPDDCMLTRGSSCYIDNSFTADSRPLWHLANHAPKPLANAEWTKFSKGGEFRFALVALQPIHPGQQVRFVYTNACGTHCKHAPEDDCPPAWEAMERARANQADALECRATRAFLNSLCSSATRAQASGLTYVKYPSMGESALNNSNQWVYADLEHRGAKELEAMRKRVRQLLETTPLSAPALRQLIPDERHHLHLEFDDSELDGSVCSWISTASNESEPLAKLLEPLGSSIVIAGVQLAVPVSFSGEQCMEQRASLPTGTVGELLVLTVSLSGKPLQTLVAATGTSTSKDEITSMGRGYYSCDTSAFALDASVPRTGEPNALTPAGPHPSFHMDRLHITLARGTADSPTLRAIRQRSRLDPRIVRSLCHLEPEGTVDTWFDEAELAEDSTAVRKRLRVTPAGSEAQPSESYTLREYERASSTVVRRQPLYLPDWIEHIGPGHARQLAKLLGVTPDARQSDSELYTEYVALHASQSPHNLPLSEWIRSDPEQEHSWQHHFMQSRASVGSAQAWLHEATHHATLTWATQGAQLTPAELLQCREVSSMAFNEVMGDLLTPRQHKAGYTFDLSTLCYLADHLRLRGLQLVEDMCELHGRHPWAAVRGLPLATQAARARMEVQLHRVTHQHAHVMHKHSQRGLWKLPPTPAAAGAQGPEAEIQPLEMIVNVEVDQSSGDEASEPEEEAQPPHPQAMPMPPPPPMQPMLLPDPLPQPVPLPPPPQLMPHPAPHLPSALLSYLSAHAETPNGSEIAPPPAGEGAMEDDAPEHEAATAYEEEVEVDILEDEEEVEVELLDDDMEVDEPAEAGWQYVLYAEDPDLELALALSASMAPPSPPPSPPPEADELDPDENNVSNPALRVALRGGGGGDPTSESGYAYAFQIHSVIRRCTHGRLVVVCGTMPPSPASLLKRETVRGQRVRKASVVALRRRPSPHPSRDMGAHRHATPTATSSRVARRPPPGHAQRQRSHLL